MTECTNIDMQEQLPELVAGTLSGAMRTAVEVHLAACAECRAELDLLHAVRQARPQPAPLDIDRIVAALPRSCAAASAADPVTAGGARADADARPFRVITGGDPGASVARRATLGRGGERRSPLATLFGSSIVRFAAALTLVAVGGLSIIVAGRSPASLTDMPRTADTAVTSTVFEVAARVEEAPADEPYAPGAVPVQPVVSVAPAVLPIQELSDYSDDELAHLLERLDAWDGAPRVDSTGVTLAMRQSDLLEEL